MNNDIKPLLDGFFATYKIQTCKKGEILIRPQDEPLNVFYLIKGQIKMYAISRKGEELILNVFKEGAFFPMSWALNNTPINYYFEAKTAASIKKAPKEKVIELLNTHPQLALDLLKRVFRGTDGIITRMSYLMSGNAYTRLIIEILIQVRRFGTKKGKEVILDISEKDLAAYSGMARETISREMKILKDKSIITYTGNSLHIYDIHTLEDELEGGV